MGTQVTVNEIKQAWKDLVDGATITIDQAEPFNKFRVTLGGNRILALINAIDGGSVVIQLGQDGTGGRTITWFSKDSTFATTDLNTTNDQIVVGRNIPTTTPLKFTSTGTLPTGLVAGTKYYAINISATVIKVATTIANAQVGTAIDFTDQGSGTHTIQTHILWTDDIEPTLSSGKYAQDTFEIFIQDATAGIYRAFNKAASGGGGAFEDFTDQGSDPAGPVSGKTRIYTKAGVLNLKRNTPGDVGMATPDAGHFVITPGAGKLVKITALYQIGEQQTTIGGPVTPIQNVYQNNTIILTGWGMFVPPFPASFAGVKAVLFGLTFALTPIVLANFLGWTNGGVAASPGAFGAGDQADKSGSTSAQLLSPTGFSAVQIKQNLGTSTIGFLGAVSGTNSWYGFSWVAIGQL